MTYGNSRALTFSICSKTKSVLSIILYYIYYFYRFMTTIINASDASYGLSVALSEMYAIKFSIVSEVRIEIFNLKHKFRI